MNLSSAVANEFFELAQNSRSKGISNMKLVKLIYIAQGISLAVLDKPIISEDIEAWQYGPVVPSIYHEFKHFGSSDINKKSKDYKDSRDWDEVYEPMLEGEDYKNAVKFTWKLYKDIKTMKLVELTHNKGTPWSLTYVPNERHKIIENELIKNYYKKFIKNLSKKLS